MEADLQLPDPVTALHQMLQLQSMQLSALPCRLVVSLSECLLALDDFMP